MFKNKRTPSLALCILLDLIGMTSYLFPFLGAAFDFIWAPVSGIIFYLLFGSTRFALFGGVFSVLEEISPGLDVIPTFTIAWFIKGRRNKLDEKNKFPI